MIPCYLISDLSYIPMPILGHIFRFGRDLRTFIEVTCAMMDVFTTFVLRTCHAPDAILGHIPFRRIFMDLLRGHMFEDRWFHATWSPTYHTFRCHTGAYFSFRMRFTDFPGGHMCDDGWFHDICSSDLSRTWCHTGAYSISDDLYGSLQRSHVRG